MTSCHGPVPSLWMKQDGFKAAWTWGRNNLVIEGPAVSEGFLTNANSPPLLPPGWLLFYLLVFAPAMQSMVCVLMSYYSGQGLVVRLAFHICLPVNLSGLTVMGTHYVPHLCLGLLWFCLAAQRGTIFLAACLFVSCLNLEMVALTYFVNPAWGTVLWFLASLSHPIPFLCKWYFFVCREELYHLHSLTPWLETLPVGWQAIWE